MIDFEQAIDLIRRNGGFKPNEKDSSYYRTYITQWSKPIQIRVSNHGTHLWTWYDKQYDPSYAINIGVVFSSTGEHESNTIVDMEIKNEEGVVIGERNQFEVIQYVYNCQLLDINDAALINQAIQNIWQNKVFNDPLADSPKHAKVMRLKPNEPIDIITESNTKNMKQNTIKLNENQLRNIVVESVKKVLKERVVYKGPSPMTISELVSQADYTLREKIQDVREFCEMAKSTPGEYKNESWYKRLIDDLYALESHAFFEYDSTVDD